jgi:DNA-binding NarL/FixJ family response regulator
MDGDPVASALVTAFNALLDVAPPGRVVPVLRQALSRLLEDEACPDPKAATATTASKARRSRTRSAGDIKSWAPLRPRILAVLAERGLSRRQLADQVGISHNTLR